MKQPTGGENAVDRNSSNASKANRPSTLLTNEENDQLFRLLGRRCQSLSTAIVQLYTTQSPAHASWVKRCTGALCFIKDNIRKSYYFRLYCLKANQMVWEQELYEKIEVTQPKPYLITFEGQDGIVALNFATEDEASAVMNTTLTTIHNRNRRRDERIKRNNTRKDPPPARPPPLQTIPGGGSGSNIPDADMGVTYRNKQPFSGPFSGPAVPAMQQFPQGQQPNLGNSTHQKPRKVKGMGKLQKSDIGSPSNFKHVTHVGWDPHSGFDLIGAQESLKPFLEKAGVGDQHLKDRDTCAFIYDFIQTNNVLDTVKSEQSSGRKQKPPAPPPVPVRTHTEAPQPEMFASEQQQSASPDHQHHDHPQQHPPSVPGGHQNGQTRNPPPPPPHRTLPPLPPTTPPKVVPSGPPAVRPPPMQPPQPTVSAPSSAPAPPPPPPLPTTAGPVPPPPPPMMPSLKPPAPAIPGAAGGGGGDECGDARSALLDSIRKGTTLKKVDQSAHSGGGSGDMRNDLMTEIQQGFQLRPVANRELNAERNSGGGSGDVGTDALADALRRALAERGRVIRPSDEDDSDSNSNNTDWED
uniref:WH1 domain-containing protein n=1 Tax=Anopheles epiroticus TaxID=199890 RepID=A0A182P7J6_9DIPT